MTEAPEASKGATWRERARHVRRAGWRRLRGGELTPLRAGGSVALGSFIGCLPVFGLHLPLCLGVCLPLRLDAPVAYLAANISNPLVAPWLLVAEVQVGAWLLQGKWAAFTVEGARATGVQGYASFAALGAVVVGLSVAVVLGSIAAAALHLRLRRSGQH